MESHLQRPSDQTGMNIGEQGEEHHEHKSVLKKVKDKAKKIKDTIKKHGHKNEHEHDEGDDDYTEETVNAPHGAPMHDSALDKSPNIPRDTDINVETHEGIDRPSGPITHEGIDRPSGPITHEGIPKPITPGMITHEGDSKPISPGPIKHEGISKPISPGPIKHEGISKPVSPGPIKHEGISKPVSPGPIKHEGISKPVSPGPIKHEGMPRPVTPGIFMHEGMAKPVSPVPLAEAFAKRPAMAGHDMGDKNSPKPKKTVGLEKDPHSPASISKSNYQSKVVDPTGDDGGKEANVAPLVGQFGNLNVLDKKPEQEQSPYHHTGTHDMFAPQKTPTKNLSNPDSNPAYTPETQNPDPSPMIQDSPTITGKIAGTAISAKNAIASKLGYGDTATPGIRPEHENPNLIPKTQDTTNPNTITGKISGTAISAKNAAASKLGYGDTATPGLRPEHENPNLSPKTQDSTNPNTITGKISSTAISAKNAAASKLGYGDTATTGLRPEHENPNLSPKTQDSTNPNTITGKLSGMAISAKDTVASKLGYGDTAAVGGLRPERHESPNPSPKNQDSTNPNTITGKISGTAISAKDTVASKLGYGGEPQAGQGHAPGGETGTMKGYLGEKLRPGDEDKALSEVITGALSKKEEAAVVVEQPGSRVKMSPEVAARLGPATESKREGGDALAAGAESSGPGMVGRLKDAVGGWLGKSDGVQTAQDSIEGSYVGDATSGGGAKRES